jgi:hypothetical protein
MSSETMHIENLIVNLSTDPYNPVLNFDCAVEYERLNQTASAVSFYLRCAEFGIDTHKDHVYASLLRMSHCFEDQKDRQWTVSGVLLQAIAFLPHRPEAWFLLSRFNERSNNWQEAYSFAQSGLVFADLNHTKLPTWVEYPGKYVLEFEKYVAAWWIGRKEESLNGFRNLLDKYNMEQQYVESSINNLKRLI